MRPLFWHIFTSEQVLKKRKEEKANNFWCLPYTSAMSCLLTQHLHSDVHWTSDTGSQTLLHPRPPQPPLPAFLISILPDAQAQTLRVLLDSLLIAHRQSFCKFLWLHLPDTSRIPPILPNSSAPTLASATTISLPDL